MAWSALVLSFHQQYFCTIALSAVSIILHTDSKQVFGVKCVHTVKVTNKKYTFKQTYAS